MVVHLVTTERRSRTRRDRWFHRVRLPDERLLQHRLEDYNKLTPGGKKTQFYSVLQLIDVTGRGCTVFARPQEFARRSSQLALCLLGQRDAGLRDRLEILARRLEALPLLERGAHRLLLCVTNQRQHLARSKSCV